MAQIVSINIQSTSFFRALEGKHAPWECMARIEIPIMFNVSFFSFCHCELGCAINGVSSAKYRIFQSNGNRVFCNRNFLSFEKQQTNLLIKRNFTVDQLSLCIFFVYSFSGNIFFCCCCGLFKCGFVTKSNEKKRAAIIRKCSDYSLRFYSPLCVTVHFCSQHKCTSSIIQLFRDKRASNVFIHKNFQGNSTKMINFTYWIVS